MEERKTDRGFWKKLFDFSFSSFVTLDIIKILYILAVAFLGIVALTILFGGAVGGSAGFLLALIFATIWFLLNVIWVRVGLELIIVIFKIWENTSFLAGRLKEREGKEGGQSH